MLTSNEIKISNYLPIVLDVGGQLFKTTNLTLDKYPDSLLAAYASRWKIEDKDNPIFFDRSPELFKYILEYMRTESLPTPDRFEKNNWIFGYTTGE